MATLDEVRESLEFLYKKGVKNKDITLLHCTSQYPTPLEYVNLKAMETMKKTFNINVGYSDHTLNYETPIAAIAMGAKNN